MSNPFYKFYISLILFFSFQVTSNLKEMMFRIWVSTILKKDLKEKLKIKKIKKKEIKKREVCRSFVLFKRCKFPTSCMFLHTADPEIIKTTICKFRMECRKINCPFGHANQIHIQDERNDVNLISDDNCGICWENIYTSKKRFGLLSCCDHKFCISCIRKHRQNVQLPKLNRNGCPVCRVTSFGYCSSKFFLTGIAKKNEFKKCEKNRANISCRDGSDCFRPGCGFKHPL
jgi:hypothetical protein